MSPETRSESVRGAGPAAGAVPGADRAVPPGGPDQRAGGGPAGPAGPDGAAPAGAGPRAAAATADRSRAGAGAGADLGLLGPVAEAASEAWIEATVRAAAGLAAGRAVGAVASAPVAALVKGAMAMMLAGRLKVVAAGAPPRRNPRRAGRRRLAAVGAARGPAARGRGPGRGCPARARPVAKAGPWIKGIVVDERTPAGRRRTGLVAWTPPHVRPRRPAPTARSSSRPTSRGPGTIASSRRPTAVRARDLPVRRTGGTRRPADAGADRAPAGPGGDGHGRRRPRGPGPGCGRLRPRPGLPGRRGADGRARHRRAPRPGRCEDAVDRRQSSRASASTTSRTTGRPRPPRFAAAAARARLVLDGVRPTVRVRVVDSAGRPVPGVEMLPFNDPEEGQIRFANLAPLPVDPRTDADGVATFDWLPADITSGSFIRSRRPTCCPVRAGPGPQQARRHADSPRPPHDTSLGQGNLPRRLARPWIRVEASGSGGPGIAKGWEFGSRDTTAADGSYEMQLMPGQSFTIKVADDEGTGPGLSGVEVHEGVPRTGLNLSLVRGPADRAGPGPAPALRGPGPGPGPAPALRGIEAVAHASFEDGDSGRPRPSSTLSGRTPGSRVRYERRRSSTPAGLMPRTIGFRWLGIPPVRRSADPHRD